MFQLHAQHISTHACIQLYAYMPCTHIYVYLRRVRIAVRFCGCIASPLNSIYLRCAELPAPTRAHLLVADC